MASYRKKHIKKKVHKIKPKKSILKRLWFWIILLSLIIIVSALYFFLFYSGIQVKNIVIFGNKKVASDDIKKLVSNDINSKILYIINSKSIFLINNNKINRDILQTFPDIEKVTINKDFPQTLTLNITERKPIGIYCPPASSGQANDQCFSIDENGIIFEQSVADPNNLIIEQTLDNNQIFAGEQVVNQNIINIISKIQKTLKDNFQIDLSQALIASSTRLNITTDENWQIYFDLSPDSDINSQLTKLNLLLINGISADDIKNLRYIDLRPKDRAIVCDNMECGG